MSACLCTCCWMPFGLSSSFFSKKKRKEKEKKTFKPNFLRQKLTILLLHFASGKLNCLYAADPLHPDRYVWSDGADNVKWWKQDAGWSRLALHFIVQTNLMKNQWGWNGNGRTKLLRSTDFIMAHVVKAQPQTEAHNNNFSIHLLPFTAWLVYSFSCLSFLFKICFTTFALFCCVVHGWVTYCTLAKDCLCTWRLLDESLWIHVSIFWL